MKEIHIPILKCFDEFKFNLGKKTLLDFVKGDPNPTINKNNLSDLELFGCMYMHEKNVLLNVINQLIQAKYLEVIIVGAGFQVVRRTPSGLKEVFEKKFVASTSIASGVDVGKIKFDFPEAVLRSEDKKLFVAFDFFLNKFNEEQKHAIVSGSSSILCVAGAGTGKTTVLTKRIEFLTKFRGVLEKDVLAITFTRKAKEEMQNRLDEIGCSGVRVDTFNSFCEKLLKRYGDRLYSRDVRVIQFRDKISIVKGAMAKLGIHFDLIIDDYFNKMKRKQKSADELFFVFMNDIFSVMDFYKNCEDEIKPFFESEVNFTKKRIAKWVYEICIEVEKQLKKKGFRDFSDQVVDVLRLFRENSDLIPNFEHVLVDEFQDVNKIQVDLLKLINFKKIFAVGDPRQSIYGWRGSEIRFILDFPKQFFDTLVVQLEKNYRSDKKIVDFFNLAINSLGLVDLKANSSLVDAKNVFLVEQDNELLERRFVLEAIKNSKVAREEIFVLARTNRTLEGFATFFKQNGVSFAIKSEEDYRNKEPGIGDIVLATVHSIKGMEAREVFIVGCNSLSFPNKVQDNFVFALVKNDNDYDKRAEELRLFYVAISRAKEKLIMTYSGNFSKFISKKMLETIEFKSKNKSLFEYGGSVKRSNLDYGNSQVLKNALKDWRGDKARGLELPAYMIISNAAIDDLVKILPSGKGSMYNVRGLGEVKIAKYGDEILKIINE